MSTDPLRADEFADLDLSADQLVVDEHFFFRALGRFKVLNHAEEIQLAREIEGGNEAARQRMIESNLRLVVYAAKRFQGRGLPLQDLVQEGAIGLTQAVERYDWRRGFRFSTYAIWWINQACQRAIDNQSRLIRLPGQVTARRRQLWRVVISLEDSLRREPTIEEVAAESGMEDHHVREALEPPEVTSSLQRPLSHDTNESVVDLVADEEEDIFERTVEENRVRAVHRLLSRLPDNDRQLIEARFGIGGVEETQKKDVARQFGVSGERLRKIEMQLLISLRRLARDDPWLYPGDEPLDGRL